MIVRCPDCGAVASYGREIAHKSSCPSVDRKSDRRRPEGYASLRDRCREFLAKAQRDAIMRQGSPVDDLMAFVVAETGRSADLRLEETLPLCLYFATNADRDEFIAAVREAKPGMVMKRMPPAGEEGA